MELTGPYMHDGRFRKINDVLNHYITGYMTKSDQGSASDMLDTLNTSGKSSWAIMKSLASQMNKCREMGIYEAISLFTVSVSLIVFMFSLLNRIDGGIDGDS